MKNDIPETIKDWTKILGYSPIFRSNKKRNILSPHLLLSQKIDKAGFKRLCKLHQKKDRIMQKMEAEVSVDTLKKMANDITEIEFQLQLDWGFKQNINYHRFWTLPKCSCPRMDNEDNWPIGYYVRTSNCIIHGKDLS